MTAIAAKLYTGFKNVNIIKNNIEKLILRIILWSFAVLALWYVFILGNMVFNIVKRRSLEKEALTLSNQVGDLELSYLSLSSKVDIQFSQSLGFRETKANFAVRKSLGFN